MSGNKIVACDVTKYDAGKNIFVADRKLISVEKFFELRLNGEHFRNIFCTPDSLEDLAVGVLAQADKISSAEDITRLEVSGSTIEVETNSDVHAAQKNFSNVRFVAKDILSCAINFWASCRRRTIRPTARTAAFCLTAKKFCSSARTSGGTTSSIKFTARLSAKKFFSATKL